MLCPASYLTPQEEVVCAPASYLTTPEEARLHRIHVANHTLVDLQNVLRVH